MCYSLLFLKYVIYIFQNVTFSELIWKNTNMLVVEASGKYFICNAILNCVTKHGINQEMNAKCLQYKNNNNIFVQ